MVRRLLLLSVLLMLSGCAWPVRDNTDQMVREMVEHPFDVAPEAATEAPAPAQPATGGMTPANVGSNGSTPVAPKVPAVVETAAWVETQPGSSRPLVRLKDDAVQTVAWTQPQPGPGGPSPPPGRYQLTVPPKVPGSEAPRIVLPRDTAAAAREIDRIFPDLPPLPFEPKVQPGPGGKPYTLADLQRLAAANSPTLRQAASDVEAAKGNLIQAKTYPNPTIAWMQTPSNNNNTGQENGGSIDQAIIMGGKQKLGSAASQKDLDNAILALKRARSDLSTAVRTAYFAVLVDVETLAVNRALAHFSDEIYRIQTGLLRGAQAAPYEPTALRAQAFTVRLAYKQAIASYIYDWKTLVATLGLPQLPLTEITGQVDRFIPYYDYDEVRAYVLRNHTDILTARNGLRKAQYNLKLTQVTPVFPDLDVTWTWQKDYGNPPFGTYQLVTIGFPVPIWDQNKGNIIATQAALVRASEESHRVEVTLTNSLALAYEGYRNNLYAMEYYRRNVLPDLVRYYRGVFARRQIDPSSAFGDLVGAQQMLSSNVTAYLGILSSLWSSAVSVADFLQTDDLFQVAKQRELPQLPDFNELSHWACGHDSVAASCARGADVSGGSSAAPGAGPAPTGPAGGVPVGPAGSATVPPPPQAGAGGGVPSQPEGNHEIQAQQGGRP